MSILFNRNDTAAKLTAEVDRLQKRKAILAAKLDAARKAETAARDSHKRYFVDGDESDISTAARLAAAVTAAVADVAAIADAIATVDAMIDEGRAAVVAAQESAARAKRASEIQERIRKIEPLCAEAEKTFERLASILEKIIETADSPDLVLREYRVIQGAGSNLPAVNLAGAALTEALFRSLPDAFAVAMAPTRTFAAASLPLMIRRDGGLSPDLPLDDDNGQGFRPLPLSGALTANLIDPLRTAAAEILNGARPLASARPIADDDPVYEYRAAVLTRPIRWRDAAGEIQEHADASADLPEPVILAAKAAGVAFDPGSREAAEQLELRYQRGVHHPSLKLNKQIVELDVKWPAPGRMAA